MLLNYLQVFAYSQLFRVVLTSNDVLNVTILLDVYDGPKHISRAGAGFLVALDAVRRKKLLPNYKINWRLVDTGCNVSALDKFIPVWKEFAEGIHAVIGPSCSDACRSIGLFTAAFRIPEVSHYCTSNKLSKKSIYTTFARTVGDIAADMPSVVLIAAQKLGWRNFHIIATRWSPWFAVAYNIKVLLDKTALPNEEVTFTTNVHIVATDDRFRKDVESTLEDIKQSNKPALIILSIAKESAYEIIGVSREKEFDRSIIAFLMIDPLQIGLGSTEIRKLLDGTVTVTYGKGLLESYERFQLKAFTAYKKEPQLQALFELKSPIEVTVEDALLHDAMLLWAIAVNQTPIQQNKPLSEAWNGKAVADQIPRIRFNGASGYINLTETGDRMANYSLGVFYQGTVYTILVQQNSTGEWGFIQNGLNQIGWKSLQLIPGTPIYDNSAIESGLIIFWCILVTLTLVSALGIVFSKCHYEVELKSIQYLLLDCDKIRISSQTNLLKANRHRKSVFSKFMPQLMEDSLSATDLLLSPHRASTSVSAKNLSITHISGFGYYDDTKIYVKSFHQRRAVHIKDRQVSIEFLQLWKLNHANINSFIGACVVIPNVILCMQFCSRGSVADIIQHKTIKLTPEFRLALAIDIAQGMKHLHYSQIGSHGHLTSTNCVVDDQWTCKITDHGLCHFRSEYLRSAEETDKDTNRLLWTAPELLQLSPKRRPICGSQMADVYSFGIILQELCYETQPFGELCYSLGSKVIVSRVKAGEDPPFRPLETLNAEHSNVSGQSPLWLLLMQDCWAQDPWQRPQFSEIILRLTIISGGKIINPVETVIKMLEEHTQKLEELVHKRSELLYEEKQKAEGLLYSVLPVQVAEEMKQGNKVNPEEFDAVTIYVSDIVEFTPLAAKSTANEVINLLSILFNMFDKLIDSFGVYKLETIGDAYVVAGGVPERNGDLHATQIASLALYILSSIFTFKIPHLPERPLKIRTGIHTGPVVAGVAGIKMPRYCLYGDTVNTAFAMEASAKPMTINVSDSTAKLLLSSKQFDLEKLELEVFEGNRKVTVYRLLSLRNLDLPMPATD